MSDDALAADLRDTLKKGGDLLLHYLPEVSFSTRRVTAVDALARWKHPVRGSVPPAEFVALAERSGTLGELTEWVVKTAFRQCRVWRDDGFPLAVSVNLSPSNLLDDRMPRLIRGQAHALGVRPEWIRLEIPESIVTGPGDVSEAASRMRGVGVVLALDDATGTDATAIAMERIGATVVKFDRAFVARIDEAPVAEAITRTVAMARKRGASVVAQGIEDVATYDALAAAGCDGGLGYLISRPLAPTALDAWLHDSPWGMGGMRAG